MVDVAAISGAIGSIKAAGDIANAMLKLHDAKSLQEKTIELNRIILAAQGEALSANGAQADLIARIRELEAEIAGFKKWEAEKEKYELKQIHPGSFAYSIKEDARGSEPPHLICQTCYENGKKRILQKSSAVHIACPECKVQIKERDMNYGGVTVRSRGYNPRI